MGDKGIILYAEDDLGTRNLVKGLIELDFPAYVTEVFEDGYSLEKRLMKGIENVRLVFTDNDMPGITGGNVIKKYSKKPGFEQIPFVLCYAGNESLGASLVKEGYAFAYILKPFGIKDFTDVLNNALNLLEELPFT